MPGIDELRATAVEASARVIETLARYENEPPTGEQLAELNALEAAASEAQHALQEAQVAQSRFGQIATAAREREGWLSERQGTPPIDRGRGRQPHERLSLGQRFATDERFRAWHAERAGLDGIIQDTTKNLQSPGVEFRGFRDLDMQAALLTGLDSTSAGALIIPDQYPGIAELGRRELGIRDVITVGQTSSDVIEFVRITGETNTAAPVAEATAAAGSSGVKPESGMTLERVSTNVVTIAHWIPATRRALSDAPQLRTLIDNFLRYGLEYELEDQIVNGTGGDGFTGILNTSGTQAQAFTTDILTTLRKARTAVRLVGRTRPNGVLMNPADVETLDLLKDAENRFYYGGPIDGGVPRVWRVPIVELEVVPEGTAIMGDFTVCILWDREQGNISVSDSHADFFIRNLIAILAEMRAAFGILRPSAIVEVDLVA
jgi:HK97 family phage major capsid protein